MLSEMPICNISVFPFWYWIQSGTVWTSGESVGQNYWMEEMQKIEINKTFSPIKQLLCEVVLIYLLENTETDIGVQKNLSKCSKAK